MRNYSGALASLAAVPAGADAAQKRLLALKGLAENAAVNGTVYPLAPVEFRRSLLEAMDRYPRDPRPLKIFFEYARNRNPDVSAWTADGDRNLLELALRRLPFVLERDADLAWMAAGFIRDSGEVRRLLSAYRAGGLSPGPNGDFHPNPGSIPPALNLGLIDDAGAVEELFAPEPELVIPADLILSVSDLLRGEAGRDLFAQKLLAFTGVITGDEDRDGIAESRAVYREGTISEYTYDADQDGLPELRIFFDSGGIPRRAEQAALPDIEAGQKGLPVKESDRVKSLIQWERYPSILQAELGGISYIPRPGEFQFAPVAFIELAGSKRYSGLLYPRRERLYPAISRRSLVSFAAHIEKPGAEFAGAIEVFDLDRGIPLRAAEILNGREVSVTEFENGLPVLQRLDLDMDGRMETIRRFRRPPPGWEEYFNYRSLLASSESDWNADGLFETAEMYLEDGSVVYSWDMNADGVREYSELKTGNEK
jgi:hypothetical protein